MDTNEDVEALKDDISREIGRCVLLFQSVEALLKAVVGNGNVRGKADEIASLRAKRIESAGKSTMGALTGDFVEGHINSSEELPDLTSVPAQGVVSLTFKLTSDSGYIAEQQAALEGLVQQRNELIHHFLPKWDWNSVADLRLAREHLVVLRDSIEKRRGFLMSVWESHQRAMKLQQAFLSSDAASEFIRGDDR